MLHWFQKSVISPESAQWINQCANWIISQFDHDAFQHKTQLITPDKAYFPDAVSSPREMAAYVLRRVTELAGISQLPWELAPLGECQTTRPDLLVVDTRTRYNSLTPTTPQHHHLKIPFVAEQTKKPQDLVAATASACAQHFLWQSQQLPPGGADYFQPAAELLAVFFGFGIVMTNSAYTFRGSCAKCYDPRANRQANLSEAENVYALALFCTLKRIPSTQVTKHLKPHLKNTYKVALKQVQHTTSAGATPSSNAITG